MAQKQVTLRQKRFADAYLRLANRTAAAIEAGYSKKRAAATGCELAKHPLVVEYIAARQVNREVHSEVTYRKLRELADAALLDAKRLEEACAEPRDIAAAKMTALKCLEVVAKIDGLMTERVVVDQNVKVTLQSLVTKASEYRKVGFASKSNLPLLRGPVAPAVDARAALDAVFTPALSPSEAVGPVKVPAAPVPPPSYPPVPRPGDPPDSPDKVALAERDEIEAAALLEEGS